MNMRMGRHTLSFLSGSLEHPPSSKGRRITSTGDVPGRSICGFGPRSRFPSALLENPISWLQVKLRIWAS
jgi:hypothetical protein